MLAFGTTFYMSVILEKAIKGLLTGCSVDNKNTD